MLNKKYVARSLWGAAILWITLSVLVTIGCSNSAPQAPQAATGSAPHEKGSAELWSQTCARCHNIRTPTEFSHGEWQVAMHHMRVRANLTGEEQRKILEFIKSAD